MRHPLLTCTLFSVSINFLLLPMMLSASEFDDFKAAQQHEFKQHEQSLLSEFEQYKKELLEAFDTYRSKVEPIWGGNSVPDQHRWVEYGQDLNERSIIDFEKGVIRNEVILDNNDDATSPGQQQRLQRLITHSLSAAADSRSIIDIAKNPVRLRNRTGPEKALLSGMVKDQKGGSLKRTNIDAFAKKQVLANSGIEQRVGTDGVTRNILYNDVSMVADHIDRRAMAYKSRVAEEATRQKLSSQLVFAIIETESSFNPNARSPVPAFGLMQLVPTSGARDAYRFLFKKDAIVTDDYLYKPDNNIELGAAYLHVLYFRYLRGIKDPESRLWAAVAAYNTGSGNIWKTFGVRGDRKNTALKKINSMQPDEVYNYLYSNLPYKETRMYVKKIRSRMAKYSDL